MKTEEEYNKEFETLESKYGKGKVFRLITVSSQEEGADNITVFLKATDRMSHAAIGTIMRNNVNNDPFLAIETAIQMCYIGGDDKDLILKNEDALFGCDYAIYEFLHKKQGELKKN